MLGYMARPGQCGLGIKVTRPKSWGLALMLQGQDHKAWALVSKIIAIAKVLSG